MSSEENFNTQLNDFFKFMLKYCDKDDLKEDLIYYDGLIKTAIRLNKKSAIEQYIIHILKFEEQINRRDEVFFMEHLTVDDVDILTDLNDESYILKCMDVRQLLMTVDNKKKKKIFDYLVVMTFYARQYFNEHYSK
jgi:hypothetical protein